MLLSIVMATCFALLIFVLRAIFKSRVSKRFIYALWVLVFIRFVTPVSLFELDILPAQTEEPQNEVAAYITQLVLPEQKPVSTAYTVESTGAVQTQTASAAQTVTSQTKDADKTNVLAVIWISGSAAVLIWAAASEIIAYSRLRRNRKLLYTRGRIRIYVSENAPGACAYGLIPSIYLSPDSASSDGAELMIAHETAHIRQLDCLREPLRRLLLAALWWNPAVWAYFLLARRDSELACDEYVAKGLDNRSRINYARIIVDSASKAHGIAVGIGGKPIKKRVKALISTKKTSAVALALAVISVCALLAASVCMPARAEGAAEIAVPAAPAGTSDAVENDNPPEPSAELPDITREEAAKLLDDGAGNIRWPAELLPEDFPQANYDGIYSVERTNGALKIIMFGGFSVAKLEEAEPFITLENVEQYTDIIYIPDIKLALKLWDSGWISIMPVQGEHTTIKWLANSDGGEIRMNNYFAKNDDPDIQAALELSGDSQYAWTLEYYQTEPRESWFAEYPDKFDDIGIPDLGVVPEFPREYLPESLSDLDKRVDVIETSVQHNGIRICVQSDEENTKTIEDVLDEAGFVLLYDLYVDEHGNTLYFYVDDTQEGRRCTVLLIRPVGYTGQ